MPFGANPRPADMDWGVPNLLQALNDHFNDQNLDFKQNVLLQSVEAQILEFQIKWNREDSTYKGTGLHL